MEYHGVVIHREWIPYFDELNDKQLASLFMALMKLGFDGVSEEPKDPSIKAAYKLIGTQIVYDVEKYRARCERNRKNAQKRRKIQPDEEKAE